MKNKMTLLLLYSFFLFFIGLSTAKAIGDGNGLQTPGGGGAGACPDSGTYEPWASYTELSHKSQTYMMDLAYKSPSDSTYKIIASAVVGKYASSNNYGQLWFDKGSRPSQNLKWLYTEGDSYNQDFSSLTSISRYLNAGGLINDLRGNINAHSDTYPYSYLKELGVLDGNNELKSEYYSDFANGQEQSPNFNDNYGYRLIIQKFTQYGVCGQTNYLGLRKESQDARNGTNGSGSIDGDLFTDEPILGISSGTSDIRGALASGRFQNKMDGTGYNILWFYIPPELFKKDYSLDMACANCKSEKADSKAIVLQDTTNWKAINNVERSRCDGQPNNNAINHFKVAGTNNTYCREEYHIYYPNATNQINVKSGRYFTLGLNDEDLYKVDAAIPNFAPVKVTRIRQCQGDDIKTVEKNSEEDFKTCGGAIKINYKEDGGYTYSGLLKSSAGSYDSSINNGTLIQESTFNFTLNDNVYSYISKKDGKPDKDGVSDQEKNKYKNLGLGILPISFKSNSKDSAKLTFKYLLPNANVQGVCEDSYSKMNEAYSAGPDNSYLTCKESNNNDNVYTKETDDEKLADTACAKLFDINSNQFKACRAERINNKFGSSSNCYTINESEDINSENNYICTLGQCTKDNYKDYGYDLYNEDLKSCVNKCSVINRKVDGNDIKKFIGKDGTEVGEERYKIECDGGKPTPECIGEGCNECTFENRQQLGRDWNKNENKCCPKDTVYSDLTKKCEYVCTGDNCDDSPRCKTCPDACCENPDGTTFCGIKINGNLVCSGKPNVLPADVVYRTLDVSNPFTYANGNERDTGENWCNYTMGSSRLKCAGNINNSIVKTVIDENKNISDEDAMYKVELDSEKISAIRNYNSKQPEGYDDFTLNCLENGDKCKISDNFKNSTGIQITGKCAHATGRTFYNNKCSN